MRFYDQNGRPAAIGEVISHDGRPYRDTLSPTGPSAPLRDLGRPIMTSTLTFGAAEKYDLLHVPATAGRYLLSMEWVHWVTGSVMGRRTVPIIVNA